MRVLHMAILLFLVWTMACSPTNTKSENANHMSETTATVTDTAFLGAGCFWCIEAVFDQLKGVVSVESGYMGGSVEQPTYEQVCEGTTGHAEIARVQFDRTILSFEELLEVFWSVHDPTTLNRQGNDIGTQYRSAVFVVNQEQREVAEAYKQQLEESGVFEDPIVTEITEASTFWIAENYHQEYFERNPGNGYCQFVVRPKVEKFQKQFKDRLK